MADTLANKLKNYRLSDRDIENIGAAAKKIRVVADTVSMYDCPYCHGGRDHLEYTARISRITGKISCLVAGCEGHGKHFFSLAKRNGFNIADEEIADWVGETSEGKIDRVMTGAAEAAAREDGLGFLLPAETVTRADEASMLRLPTGYPTLDRMLKGGLAMGQLVNVVGQSGQGKSTFASTLAISALNYAHKTLLISGELTAGYTDDWLIRQIAGDKVIANKNVTGDEYYTVLRDDEDKIKRWYTGLLYYYEPDPYDGTKLIDQIRRAITKAGIDVVLIDNLMTAMGMEGGSDLYTRQGDFTLALEKLAAETGALIVLVVHEKKPSEGSKSDDYVAMGSSVIDNAAGTILRFCAPDGKTTNRRTLKVTKNRYASGMVTSDAGIELQYDKPSCRLYEPGKTMWQLGLWHAQRQIDPTYSSLKPVMDAIDDDALPFN